MRRSSERRRAERTSTYAAPVKTKALPFRSGLAWTMVAAFSLLGMCFWGVSSWLTGALIERGWSEGSAASATALLNVAAVVGNAAVFLLARQLSSRRFHMMLASGFIWIGVTMLAVMPTFAFAWATLVGIGNGLLFPALLTLPLDVADDSQSVAAATAMMLAFGYGLSGLSPFILGAARDLTGAFDVALWIAMAFATALVLVVASLSGTRLAKGIPGSRVEQMPPIQ